MSVLPVPTYALMLHPSSTTIEKVFLVSHPGCPAFVVVFDTVAVGDNRWSHDSQIHCDNLVTFIYDLHLQCLRLSWLHTQVKVTQVITNLIVRQHGAHSSQYHLSAGGCLLRWLSSQRHQDEHNHDEYSWASIFLRLL